MCGVIGLVYERDRDDLGKIAAELLRVLEYRGYDSTGAAIQSGAGEVVLRKGVGAPSAVAEPLGITELSGRIFCGQVRWATFGSVDAENAQPHVVGCRTPLYGAHNGNVTNCDDLQAWLRAEAHQVCSDNDGEMVVHTIEHHLAVALGGRSDPDRRACMREAIVQTGRQLQGSYSAVIVDPITRVMWAIKAGSSLYVGVGEDEQGGAFTVASSDLSSVLKLTRTLLPVARGEVVEIDPGAGRVFGLTSGEVRPRALSRSRLLVQDIALQPPYECFMEQEIAAQERTCRTVATLFTGGTPRLRVLGPMLAALPAAARVEIDEAVDGWRRQSTEAGLRGHLGRLRELPAFADLEARVPPSLPHHGFVSAEAALLVDLEAGGVHRRSLELVDAWLEHAEVAVFDEAVDRFIARCAEAQVRGGRIYVVCCGSSYNAAKAAALFFNELARVQLLPVIPGEFRGQYGRSLQDGDVFIAVSQSGETKDLVDVLSAVIASGRDVARMAVVNNVNSTLAQELCDLVVPLHCGPEIAVPATKSFINQLAVFYGLALRLGERRVGAMESPERGMMAADLARRRAALPDLGALVQRAIATSAEAVEVAAELLFLTPSMHILATRISPVAQEGALKVREVVLNHTEGFEGSEFKHGPNTILGFNTLYGPREVRRLLERAARLGDRVDLTAVFDPGDADTASAQALFDALHIDYPLIYVTGPEPVDVALTVSQINTHKIRGSTTVVVAEPDPALRQAAEKAPAGHSDYRSVYIPLPATGDHLMTVFTATVALQRLALVMSQRKSRYLEALGIRDHGVHPDVPKNVSKSITVD